MEALTRKVTRMTGEQVRKERNTGIAHYVRLFALWVLLIGLGLAAIHFAQSGDDSGDYAYVLLTASLAVALLDQLWKMRP